MTKTKTWNIQVFLSYIINSNQKICRATKKITKYYDATSGTLKATAAEVTVTYGKHGDHAKLKVDVSTEGVATISWLKSDGSAATKTSCSDAKDETHPTA